jgi:hypothetical protein
VRERQTKQENDASMYFRATAATSGVEPDGSTIPRRHSSRCVFSARSNKGAMIQQARHGEVEGGMAEQGRCKAWAGGGWRFLNPTT